MWMLTLKPMYLHTVQPKKKRRTKCSFNQFGMKFWPNLHVNWMQLNLQIGYLLNLVWAFLFGCTVNCADYVNQRSKERPLACHSGTNKCALFILTPNHSLHPHAWCWYLSVLVAIENNFTQNKYWYHAVNRPSYHFVPVNKLYMYDCLIVIDCKVCRPTSYTVVFQTKTLKLSFEPVHILFSVHVPRKMLKQVLGTCT